MQSARDLTTGQDRLTGLINGRWLQWLIGRTERIDQSPQRLSVSVTAENQQASIASQFIALAEHDGLYRITVYARLTQAATSSSSLEVTLEWTDNAVSCTLASGAESGNQTTTVIAFSATVRVSGNSNLTFSTTYASAGATPMIYKVEAIAERLAD